MRAADCGRQFVYRTLTGLPGLTKHTPGGIVYYQQGGDAEWLRG